MLILILLLLIGYVLPSYIAWLYQSKSYFHPHGEFYNLAEPCGLDVFVTLCPFLNIGITIDYIAGGWKDDRYKKEKKYYNFFKPFKPYKVNENN